MWNPLGAKVSYDNAKHELGVGLHVKLGNMFKAIGFNVGGELEADWKTVLPHRDSRENLLVAIISITGTDIRVLLESGPRTAEVNHFIEESRRAGRYTGLDK
jgi:hypothetical protein